jgi:uncharacterized membrane protein
MFPFFYGFGVWWFLPFVGIFVFMMLACFLFRRVFRGGMFCCAGGAGGRGVAPDDPVGILKSRYARGEIGREEYERMKREIREE